MRVCQVIITIRHPTQARHGHHLLDTGVRAPVCPVTRVPVGGHIMPRVKTAATSHLQVGRVQTTVVNVAKHFQVGSKQRN